MWPGRARARARARARTRVPAVITAGEHRVYFDGELEVGEGRGRACYMAVTPRAQLLPSLFWLIMVAAGGGAAGGGT